MYVIADIRMGETRSTTRQFIQSNQFLYTAFSRKGVDFISALDRDDDKELSFLIGWKYSLIAYVPWLFLIL